MQENNIRDKVIAAIKNSDNNSVSIGSQSLFLSEKSKDSWKLLPDEIASFFKEFPSIIWNEGGLGGKICLVAEHVNFKKINKILPNFSGALVIGSDESELFLVLPGSNEIWGVDLFLERAEIIGDIFSVVNDFIE
jgi:hypothetical protein